MIERPLFPNFSGQQEGALGKPTTGLPPETKIIDIGTEGPTGTQDRYQKWVDDVTKRNPENPEKPITTYDPYDPVKPTPNPIPPSGDPTPKAPPKEDDTIDPQIPKEKLPPVVVDTKDKKWYWNECNGRWWTPDLEKPKFTTNGFTTNNKKVIWSTYDKITNEWVRRDDDRWCDPGDPGDKPPGTPGPPPTVPPIDDCAKYGINCPEPLPSGKVFTRISSEDVLPTRSEIITYGIWGDNVGNLTTFFECPQSASVTPYHRVIYNKSCGACGSSPQFDIAYGHDAGSGSVDLGGYDYLTPTNAIYGQYRLLCLDDDEEKFKIGQSELDQIYVINVRRAQMQERLDEGNIELNLAHLSGSQYLAGGGTLRTHTGSNVALAGNGQVLRLIDDSRIDFDVLSEHALSGSYADQEDVKAHRVAHGGDVYYMVSGSLERGIHNESNPHVYGLLYPHLGIMVLDADRLDTSASFASVTTTEVAGDNASKLLLSISGAAQETDPSGDVLGFQARRKETQYAEYYFIRVKNSDYNFTNNPTFQTGSLGRIDDKFIDDPKVYFSTIGLYNEQKECIAVGKVTRPIQKTCTSEALFKIRLKY